MISLQNNGRRDKINSSKKMCQVHRKGSERVGKCFNVTGACVPELHYMVKLDRQLEGIRKMVDAGNYFSINRARQSGKSTTLASLARLVKQSDVVVQMDFQMFSEESFATEGAFVRTFNWLVYMISKI